MNITTNPAGMLQPPTLWGVHNNLVFFIQQALARLQTATIVKVIACSNDGDLSPVGTVDVQILVNQISGQGIGTPHVTMYGLPYLRIQGGENAVIIDPKPGDIGIAVFASRDITKIKSTKAQANPGSFRMHDFADGMYLGGLLNGTPTQYIQFTDSGVNIVSTGNIAISTPANVTLFGGAVTAVANPESTGQALVTADWLEWFTLYFYPWAVSSGYSGPLMPSASQTTILKGE